MIIAACRPRRLPPAQTTLVLAGEGVLLAAYASQDAVYHWLIHFLVGGAAALLLTAATSLVHRRALGHIGAAVFTGHAVAAFPDALFLLGVAHARWMDVFLGHLSSHDVPGGLWTLYAAFLTALAGYLLTLARHSTTPPSV